MSTVSYEWRRTPGGGPRVIRLGIADMADIAGRVQLKSESETMAPWGRSTDGRPAGVRPPSAGGGALSTRQLWIAVASAIAIVASLAFIVARAAGRDERHAEALAESRVLVCQSCKGVYKIGRTPALEQLPKNLRPQGGGGYTGTCDLCGKTDATFLLEYRVNESK